MAKKEPQKSARGRQRVAALKAPSAGPRNGVPKHSGTSRIIWRSRFRFAILRKSMLVSALGCSASCFATGFFSIQTKPDGRGDRGCFEALREKPQHPNPRYCADAKTSRPSCRKSGSVMRRAGG